MSHYNCLINLCLFLGLTTQSTISQLYWDAFLGITSIWQHFAISQIETQDLIFLVSPQPSYILTICILVIIRKELKAISQRIFILRHVHYNQQEI